MNLPILPIVVAVDFETTSNKPDAPDCHPIEIGAYAAALSPSKNFDGLDPDEVIGEYVLPDFHPFMQCLMNPGAKIPPETSAVHHICDRDVIESPPPFEVFEEFADRLKNFHGRITFVAHNASFEQAVFARFKPLAAIPADWICTYKCALVAWPDAPSHSNEGLRYWLRCQHPRLGRAGMNFSHSAGHDAHVTSSILIELMKHGLTLAQMVEISSQPARLPKIKFGKHAGSKWADIPADYLKWMVKQADMDADAVYCAKLELERRLV